MAKKLTIEYIRAEFEKRGWTLLSEVYERNDAPLTFWCTHGQHEHQVTWQTAQRGSGCGLCSNNKRYTTEFIRSKFKERGWKLLSEYVNAHSLLDFKCNNNHTHKISWDSFRRGSGCGLCAINRPLTTEFIRSEFEKRGWKLLGEYKRSDVLLDFECEYNHVHKISWDNFKQGVGCGSCAGLYEKSETEIESEKIAESLRGTLKRRLEGKRFDKSKNLFCNELAKQILAKIGPRPISVSINEIEIEFDLDHVIPKAWFDHTALDQIYLCWHVDNFQWLKSDENAKKRHYLTEEMFEVLTPYQVIIANLALRRPKQQEILMREIGLWMSHHEATRKLKKYQKSKEFVIQLDLFDLLKAS